MAYRGRLIQPFLAEMHRLDLAGMAAAGRLDEDYREVKGARIEMPPLRIPAQIEPDSFQRQMRKELGDVKAGVFGLTFHFVDLEELGLVDPATGIALIRPNDRMGAIYEMNGTLVQQFPDPPGMYVEEATPSLGLGGKRNLLIVRLMSRG